MKEKGCKSNIYVKTIGVLEFNFRNIFLLECRVSPLPLLCECVKALHCLIGALTPGPGTPQLAS